MKLFSRRIALQIACSMLAIIVALAVFDGLMIATGILPPTYIYGDPQLGWYTPPPDPGPMDWCADHYNRKRIDYYRNEIGIRTHLTAEEIRSAGSSFIIAAVGDSQSNLCAKNADTHQGVLEAELQLRGEDAIVLSYGVGAYSPLQAYILYKTRLGDLGADALLLNFYTGNDFYDMLRVDDRPHFVPAGDAYEIRPPVWYVRYDPDVERYSRVMFVFRSMLDRVGVRHLYARLSLLHDMASEQGGGLMAIFRYVTDLRKSKEPSIGYIGAFAAQFLNQQLFFHHFPSSDAEAVRRVRELMKMIRMENPDLMLIMSPIPSYQFAGVEPLDAALLQTLDRLPIDHTGGLRQEERLYESLRQLAAEEGWLFIDNLGPLRGYKGSERLYNDFDYHLLPPANALIGENEAQAIRQFLSQAAGGSSPRSRAVSRPASTTSPNGSTN